jgi:predicted glutamine amidotransferase
MCRLFAIRANQPASVGDHLVSAAHSLMRQGCRDRRGECHENGWGIGYFVEGLPRVVRSVLPAFADAGYRRAAESLSSDTVLAHVRNASVGAVTEANCHPFVWGKWLFAHNGTLFGFDQDTERLRQQIAKPLLARLTGETDSEHAFLFVLTRLQEAGFDLQHASPDATALGQAFADALRRLEGLYPGTANERSQLNFVLSDGHLLLASRWRHTLFFLEQRGASSNQDERAADYHGVLVASEPTSDGPWMEVADHSILVVSDDLTHRLIPVAP